jgi:SAM-dependent methyltransferase
MGARGAKTRTREDTVIVWDGAPYEAYIGRWSRVVARDFLSWLGVPRGGRWLDVGCGTGALSEAILRDASPAEVVGCDPTAVMVDYARQHVTDERATFQVADARSLPFTDGRFDLVVSGLVLNFIPSPEQGLAEMVRVAQAGGTVAAYVWDYAGEMQLMRHFWDAAVALDPVALDLDEGRRFPICQPAALETRFRDTGLADVVVSPIDIPTVFRDFDDYWLPFLGTAGPAANYATSLTEEHRSALRDRIRAGLPAAPDGSIPLMARAWAVRGTV